jgi:phosphoribosylaminoimidazole carboxylase (NCAIR synthetase)
MIPPDKIIHIITTMTNYKDLPKKCKLVFINVNKIDNSWKRTKDYIGKFYTIKSYSSKQKRLNSKKDLIELKVSVPPYIYLDNNGNIDFCNGRNRFANLRDSGVKEMPFVIETKDYKKFISACKM